MTRQQYDSWSRLLALGLKIVGIVGIIFIPVFWALTNRVELAFLPFFGTMAGVGYGVDILKEISLSKKEGGDGSDRK